MRINIILLLFLLLTPLCFSSCSYIDHYSVEKNECSAPCWRGIEPKKTTIHTQDDLFTDTLIGNALLCYKIQFNKQPIDANYVWLINCYLEEGGIINLAVKNEYLYYIQFNFDEKIDKYPFYYSLLGELIHKFPENPDKIFFFKIGKEQYPVIKYARGVWVLLKKRIPISQKYVFINYLDNIEKVYYVSPSDEDIIDGYGNFPFDQAFTENDPIKVSWKGFGIYNLSPKE